MEGLTAPCPFLDDLPFDILWRIVFLLESDRLSLYRVNIASVRVRTLLSRDSSWKRIIHARFKTVHSNDHINLYLDRLCSLKSLYHRLCDLDECLNAVHSKIGENLHRRLSRILSGGKVLQ